jgi:hypothetical protein
VLYCGDHYVFLLEEIFINAVISSILVLRRRAVTSLVSALNSWDVTDSQTNDLAGTFWRPGQVVRWIRNWRR